ncbi:ATP-binding protein [Zunongwangia sp. F363]|uniref:histidine kinase n=1 Tax=Autumnicola tepida TaxID=3075595 RepID=A0ABU3CED9_9FLAO|nr:ATP-binding protein [Zunongwangia sp. F363]MDT0644684.1 ATP-binding protein [Zunongwangia sp. F363]
MAPFTHSYSEKVNVTNCDREPIHIIARAQAHGVILVCDKHSLKITQCSENVEELLGFELKGILSKKLSQVIPSAQAERLQQKISSNETLLPEEIQINDVKFFLIPHLSGENLIIDFEPFGESIDPILFQEQLTKILGELGNTGSIKEMCQQAVSLVKYLFDYDRVMMYHFDEEWNGEVVAEVREEGMESWLGLHYPATDIPKPAREIFMKQGVRIISDVNYRPSPIYPELSPINNEPLDISGSELRGVSPIHIEYLQNMKVGASLTAAIILNGKLWGLLACHHNSPKFINYHQRQSCKFLTQVLSNKLALKNTNTFLKKIKESEKIRKELVMQMNSIADIVAALVKYKPRFTDLIECSGGAIYRNGKICLSGSTPSEEEVMNLILNFLGDRKEKVFQTKSLKKVYAPAEVFKDKASGILSVRLGEEKQDYVIWFRTEATKSVSWGGNPEKNGYVKNGVEYLSPRKSFERWTQKVSGVAKAWESFDIEAAQNLRDSITHVVVKKQKDEIDDLNRNLSDANAELETFSYSVSHDLRAPLRGIDGYARILKDNYQEKLDAYGQNAINTILGSAEKMEELIEDILSYSKVGQTKLVKQVFSLQNLVEEIIASQSLETQYPKTKVNMNDLPKITGDRRMIKQLMANLLENAFKYSSGSQQPEVVIGCESVGGENIFYVKDNGIGFNPEHQDRIFDVFSRLAGEEYSGTGVGLAIAKRVVEKHEGSIWVETKPGLGSAFFFTLKEE